MDKGTPQKDNRVTLHEAAQTHPGKVRTANEDSYGSFPEIAFYVVADGMGGHAGGEIASALAVETMKASIVATHGEDLTPVLDFRGQATSGGSRLLMAVEQANTAVLTKSQEELQLAGMGTTIAAVLFDSQESQVNICHVGDSRVYRIRGQTIELLTEDHTLVQQLVRDGHIKSEDRETFPHRHILLQAVGNTPTVSPTIRAEKPEDGDIFLLCSDGVHDVVHESDMLAVIGQMPGQLQQACDKLLELANERGGPDNETILLVRYGGQ